MSTNRTTNAPGRPLKPTLSSTRTSDRSPLTPRVAVTAATTNLAARRTPVSTPRIRQNETSKDDEIGSNNVTPRSAKRRSRVEQSFGTPSHDEALERPWTVADGQNARGVALVAGQNVGRNSLQRSPYSEPGLPRPRSAFIHSPINSEVGVGQKSDESRFFHASDIAKVEPEVQKVETKKTPAFFYANGQQEQGPPSRELSPARAGKRVSSSYTNRASTESPAIKPQQPLLSPALSTISSTSSPYFAAAVGAHKPRSPSPSKENIHLSYRKGVSQIFGSRPSPIPSQRETPDRRPSLPRPQISHQKSTSLSSIDSEISHQSRRRSNTAHDMHSSTPLREEASFVEEVIEDSPQLLKQPPLLDTALSPTIAAETGPLSPSKSISELAADARRERKVLDLEISNSSLLAINASLEREIRRQKAELKRFRRLSQAGRLSLAQSNGTRMSSNLDELAEDDAELQHFALFGPASGHSDMYYDESDSDDGESSVLSGETDENGFRADRLAKDERRLRADLDKHRELLVQSQSMNQSLRRCMYATEEMIKDGKRALDYKVRVSDIKLGGRVLSEHGDEDDQPSEQIEVEDDFDSNLASPALGVEDHASSFVEIWGNVGRFEQQNGRISLETSEGGDRDSGIEVDKSFSPALNGMSRLDATTGSE